MATTKDLIGQRFGRLQVIDKSERKDGHTSWWVCKCDCGTVKEVRGNVLKKGGAKSCGCLNRELSAKRILDINTKHGWYGTRLYHIWRGMKDRCYNPKTRFFPEYGGRGISICSEWKDNPKAFCEWAISHGYSDDLSIDRIDNDGNYEPSNCRWVTMNEQQLNKRNNVNITYNGETHCVAEWARLLGVNQGTIYTRIRHGFTDPSEIFFGRKKGAYTWQ